MKKISFVIPCYNSEKTIVNVVEDIQSTMNESLRNYDYEIILVNDGSSDNTFSVIKELVKRTSRIKGINLAKNVGQQGALMAGFNNVNGDLVVCLDDDGQTPPSEVTKLISKFEDGYDVVYAKYKEKKQSKFRNFGSFINDKMSVALINKPKDLVATSYYVADRFIIDEIIKYDNPYPYILGLILRTTNNIANVDIEHRERTEGKSGYTFRKLIGLWVNGVTSFSVVPLRVATWLGFIMSFIAVIFFIVIFIRKLVTPSVQLGWSSIMSLILLVSGIMMAMLGMLGEYIGRIHIGLNNSPQYVIKDIVGNREDK